MALAVAESCLEFEHRDLHWGNLLINTVPDTTRQVYRLRGQDWNVRSPGLRICLIDFTLSRLIGPHGTVKCSTLDRDDISWLFSQIEEVVNPQVRSSPSFYSNSPLRSGSYRFLLGGCLTSVFSMAPLYPQVRLHMHELIAVRVDVFVGLRCPELSVYHPGYGES